MTEEGKVRRPGSPRSRSPGAIPSSRVRPRPQPGPPGIALTSKEATKHFTSAHTRSWPESSEDARGDRYVKPERSRAQRGRAGTRRAGTLRSAPPASHSARPPLPLPTRRDVAPPTSLAPRLACGAYLHAAKSRILPGSTRGPPAMCWASRAGVVTAPLTACFLLFPPSHLPPNPLLTPASRPGRPIRQGRPPLLSSCPRPSPLARLARQASALGRRLGGGGSGGGG
ncbi:uncharacterized protein LOC144371593 [Ictidomys tridecemlineatus]